MSKESTLDPCRRAALDLQREKAVELRARLERLKPEQRPAFDSLRRLFPDILEALAPGRGKERAFLNPTWVRLLAEVEKDLRPQPAFDFLEQRVMRRNMRSTLVPREVREVVAAFEQDASAERAREALLEDPVGGPRLLVDPLSSENRLCQLGHLARYRLATGDDLSGVRTVIEWGGGYGCMASVFKRLHSGLRTYVIIDASIMSTVQWLYLATIFGRNAVRILTRNGDAVEEGKINLLPLSLLEQCALPAADLFLSTFALDESAPKAQDHVLRTGWFGAPRLLLGYHCGPGSLCSEPGRILDALVSQGVTPQRLAGSTPEVFFAFR